MRVSPLIVTILLASALAAQQPAIGPEMLLGDASLAPLGAEWSVGTPSLATDGDEILMVWTGRSSLYAQRLDGEGRNVTRLPVLLVRGTSQVRPVDTSPKVLYTGGLYTIFYGRLSEERKWETWVMRVTRELEIVEQRVFLSDSAYNIVRDGDEILLMTKDTVYRLRDDLSVIGTVRLTQGFSGLLVPSPHGTLLVSGDAPAITLRMIDESVSVRLASADSVSAVRAMWTGTQFLVVWQRCLSGTCDTSLVTLDERLRTTFGPVQLEHRACSSCGIHIALIGKDDAFVTWGGDEQIRGRRVREGSLQGRPAWDFGSTRTIFVTARGLMLVVDRRLNVRAFVPDALSQSPSTLPVVSAPQAAVEETIVAAAASPYEAVVVRRRGDTNVASILDHEGRTLREVALPSGSSVTLAHDGRDFYAVVGSRFQKLETGAPVVQLPFIPAGALVWAGSGFVILQSQYPYHTGETQYRTRMLWLTRAGTVELMPCPNWEFPSSAAGAPVVVVQAGGETVIVVGKHLARLRDGCPAGPGTEIPDLPYSWRPAWQNGQWAWVSTVTGYDVDLWLADDPASTRSHRSVAERVPLYESNPEIAPLSGYWLVAYNDGSLRAALADRDGRLLSTSMVSPAASGRTLLVPLSAGRVLAVYARQVPEPPYLGVTRVMVRPLTLEAPTRRRAVRP